MNNKSKNSPVPSVIVDAGFVPPTATKEGDGPGEMTILPEQEGPATEMFFVPLISFLEDSTAGEESESEPDAVQAR